MQSSKHSLRREKANAGCCELDGTQPDAQLACGELVTSTCGAYRVIGIGTLGLGTYRKQYYDASGANVGVRVWSDIPEYCGGTRWSQAYGDVPTCDEVPTIDCHRTGYINPISNVE